MVCRSTAAIQVLRLLNGWSAVQCGKTSVLWSHTRRRPAPPVVSSGCRIILLLSVSDDPTSQLPCAASIHPSRKTPYRNDCDTDIFEAYVDDLSFDGVSVELGFWDTE